jgi:hypothetical protein
VLSGGRRRLGRVEPGVSEAVEAEVVVEDDRSHASGCCDAEICLLLFRADGEDVG